MAKPEIEATCGDGRLEGPVTQPLDGWTFDQSSPLSVPFGMRPDSPLSTAPRPLPWWKAGLATVGLMTRNSERTVRKALEVLNQRRVALETELGPVLPQIEELLDTRDAIRELRQQLPTPILPEKE